MADEQPLDEQLLAARVADHNARANMWNAIAQGVGAIATAVLELIAEEREERGKDNPR